MSESLIAAGILALGAALCFRIAWEEHKWPTKPKEQDHDPR